MHFVHFQIRMKKGPPLLISNLSIPQKCQKWNGILSDLHSYKVVRRNVVVSANATVLEHAIAPIGHQSPPIHRQMVVAPKELPAFVRRGRSEWVAVFALPQKTEQFEQRAGKTAHVSTLLYSSSKVTLEPNETPTKDAPKSKLRRLRKRSEKWSQKTRREKAKEKRAMNSWRERKRESNAEKTAQNERTEFTFQKLTGKCRKALNLKTIGKLKIGKGKVEKNICVGKKPNSKK